MQPERKKGRSAFKILTGKPTGKDLQQGLGMDLKEIGINIKIWVDSAQEKLVGCL